MDPESSATEPSDILKLVIITLFNGRAITLPSTYDCLVFNCFQYSDFNSITYF